MNYEIFRKIFTKVCGFSRTHRVYHCLDSPASAQLVAPTYRSLMLVATTILHFASSGPPTTLAGRRTRKKTDTKAVAPRAIAGAITVAIGRPAVHCRVVPRTAPQDAGRIFGII